MAPYPAREEVIVEANEGPSTAARTQSGGWDQGAHQAPEPAAKRAISAGAQ